LQATKARITSEVSKSYMGRGGEVRALLRPGKPDRGLGEMGVEIVNGDITEPESLKGIAGGCDTVFHLRPVSKTGAARLVPREYPRRHAEPGGRVDSSTSAR
jgi:uncharacterized protein YbjT (DUF2867 family)